jgi:hypothetical protein
MGAVYGYISIWVYGCLGMGGSSGKWVSRCMGVYCIGVRVYGVFWVYGRMDVWVYRCMLV